MSSFLKSSFYCPELSNHLSYTPAVFSVLRSILLWVSSGEVNFCFPKECKADCLKHYVSFLSLCVSSGPVHRADRYLHIAFLIEKFVSAVGTWSWLEHVTSKNDLASHSVGGHPGNRRRTQWVETSPREEIATGINFIMRTGKSSTHRMKADSSLI